MILQIKNMVCPRCVTSVRSILADLKLSYTSVELGKVEMEKELTENQLSGLSQRLESNGFALLNSEESQIINAIKSFVINKVHHSDQLSHINLSEELSSHLHSNYSKLSKTFSRSEHITIEQFLLKQRVERVKELLSYEEKNISEIAFELGFSSTAHLSGQFKKITGMTPSSFKKLIDKPRNSLDMV